MLEDPAAKPDTTTCATPELFVFTDAALTPSTVGSVAAKVTSTPGIETPPKFLTVAVNVAVAPPTISDVLTELEIAMLPPTTVT
jgi:hypothetical protein